ncbi:hypothetical protein ACKUB1_11025 [Methanospirillum stamsii]|uniref:DUF3821 domain-containing protein n=1 Tax=Methanospirillum stamsii TaxID=1277351 RepID=A0A2V2MPZ4_9EURY|nr:hypothetical protein [Methanospirillum stamsii]PWR69479.1 hypothetical protein DLD82_18080 [Methanospirillum stamsii]
MKKKYLTYSGILSAIILVGLFVAVFLIKSPILFLIPVFTIDPVTEQNVDEYNFLILSGKTTLPEKTNLIAYVCPVHNVTCDNEEEIKDARGNTWITPGNDEWNSWNATINLSPLENTEYQVVFKIVEYIENYTRTIESGPVGSVQFVLGDENCTGNCIRKKQLQSSPFIRINQAGYETGHPDITGITNLAPGTILKWTIEGDSEIARGNNIEGNCMVIPGIEGINRWSVTPPEDMRPGSYPIRVINLSKEMDLRGKITPIIARNEFEFTENNRHLIPNYEKTNKTENILPVYLTIDALPEMNIGKTSMISGTTNLPSGEILFIEIIPKKAFQDYNFTINPRDSSQGGIISGISGCTHVENGTNGSNLWAFEIQTHPLQSGEYKITVSNTDLLPGTMEPIAPTASCTRFFILEGGSS